MTEIQEKMDYTPSQNTWEGMGWGDPSPKGVLLTKEGRIEA